MPEVLTRLANPGRCLKEVPGLSFKAEASEGQITALIQCLSDTGADPLIQPAPTQERPPARSRAQQGADTSCWPQLRRSLAPLRVSASADMHLCIYACTDGPRGSSSGAEECERVPGQRIKPQIKGRRRNCRISQLLTGGGGGWRALWLESLILNNLAVAFAPVLVGVGVLVLAASIIHMQLTA